MAKIPTFDPLTTEARSPLIAGITDALSKLSGILNLKTSTLQDSPLSEVYISEEDRYRIYQAPIGKKLWLSSPSPVFKKNGVEITEVKDNFSIDYLGGSIVFSDGYTLTADDTVTVSCTYIVEESTTIDTINQSIANALDTIEQYKGYFSSYEELTGSHSSSEPGDFAIVGGTENNFYLWNSTTGKWEPVFKITDLSDYYDKSETDNLLGQKEPTISKQGETSNSDNYYYGGRKTWIELLSKIRGTTLDGLSTATGGTISATDSILSAIGKLQKQITDSIPPILSTGAPTEDTVGSVGQDYINTSNGDKYHLVSISDGKYTWVKHPYPAFVISVSLSQSGWSGNEQTVSNAALLSDGYAYVISSDADSYTAYASAMVYAKDVTLNGSITFVCSEVPESDLNVNIIRVEVQ